jgi:hypothetical protein
LAGAVVALGLMAGCSNGTPAPADTPSATATAAAKVDPCALVTAADANAALKVTDMKVDVPTATTCSYGGSTANVTLSVFARPFDLNAVQQKLALQGVTPTVVPGLGDYAYVFSNPEGTFEGEVWAKGLDIQIDVDGGDNPVTAMKSLLQAAVGHIPVS